MNAVWHEIKVFLPPSVDIFLLLLLVFEDLDEPLNIPDQEAKDNAIMLRISTSTNGTPSSVILFRICLPTKMMPSWIVSSSIQP